MERMEKIFRIFIEVMHPEEEPLSGLVTVFYSLIGAGTVSFKTLEILMVKFPLHLGATCAP